MIVLYCINENLSIAKALETYVYLNAFFPVFVEEFKKFVFGYLGFFLQSLYLFFT